MSEISLQDWYMRRGFYFRQASDAARAIDAEAARFLSTASEIAFWNADSINRVLLYEAEGCVEIDTVIDKTPVITSIDEAALVRNLPDGELLPNLARLLSHENRLNIPGMVRNVHMKEEEFKDFVHPLIYSAIWSMPAFTAAAANRIWIKLLMESGDPIPREPKFPYPEEAIADKMEDYYKEPHILCPVCGCGYFTYVLKDIADNYGGIEEYTALDKQRNKEKKRDEDWKCHCGCGLNEMINYPVYRRIA